MMEIGRTGDHNLQIVIEQMSSGRDALCRVRVGGSKERRSDKPQFANCDLSDEAVKPTDRGNCTTAVTRDA